MNPDAWITCEPNEEGHSPEDCRDCDGCELCLPEPGPDVVRLELVAQWEAA